MDAWADEWVGLWIGGWTGAAHVYVHKKNRRKRLLSNIKQIRRTKILNYLVICYFYNSEERPLLIGIEKDPPSSTVTL